MTLTMVLAVSFLVLAWPAPARGGPVTGGLHPSVGLGNTAPIYSNITYNSSVDGFPLSYGELLPTNYNPAVSYPLLVYFHGEGKSPTIVPGGSGNGLALWNSSSLATSRILIPIVMNASAYHFIIIGPSPRSAEGFYTNSTCGGPEEQDTMDAIVHEESIRHVSGLYALGFSMGSMGALSFVGHHASMFKALAVTGTLTDAFEEIAYKPSLVSGLLTIDCGVFPSPTNASAVQLFTYLTVTRFHPQNFSAVRMWISGGGLDHGATNNLTYWPYMQANDTVLTRSCVVASSYSEPKNCTLPFSQLHVLFPTLYSYRYIYEPLAGHTLGQLEPKDMYLYFLGRLGGGCFTSTFPPTVNTPCP